MSKKSPTPLVVLVTGAAGQIGYSLLAKIAHGEIFGSTPIILHLLDIPLMSNVLKGVVMELQDCAYPLLKSIIATTDVETAFRNIDVAILVGALPRRQGMQRKDLLAANANIFATQGEALDMYAKKTVKVLVVGNPANTNALICQKCAPTIPKENILSLNRLDHNRLSTQVAVKLNQVLGETDITGANIKNVISWGNHSITQYPDVRYATFNGKRVLDILPGEQWYQEKLIETVSRRGANVIAARKLSSAMSAAKAICDAMRDWWFGTDGDNWVSTGVPSEGNEYGVPEGLVFSFPCRFKNGKFEIVKGLDIDEFSKLKIKATVDELVAERKEGFCGLGLM